MQDQNDKMNPNTIDTYKILKISINSWAQATSLNNKPKIQIPYH